MGRSACGTVDRVSQVPLVQFVVALVFGVKIFKAAPHPPVAHPMTHENVMCPMHVFCFALLGLASTRLPVPMAHALGRGSDSVSLEGAAQKQTHWSEPQADLFSDISYSGWRPGRL